MTTVPHLDHCPVCWKPRKNKDWGMTSTGETWCPKCTEFYNDNRQHFHPLDIRGTMPLAGGRLGYAPLHATLPGYMAEQSTWASIGFDVDEMRRMMQAQGRKIRWPAGYLPSAPKQQPPPAPPKPSIQAPPPGPTNDVCDCCGRNVPTPFHHDNKWPRTDGYDYCADCNNAGCGDPEDRCQLTEEVLKVAEHAMQITERAKKEMQLKAGIGSDGGNLSESERAEITAWLATNQPVEVQPQTVDETFASPPAEVAPGTPSILDLIQQQGVGPVEDASTLVAEGLSEEDREALADRAEGEAYLTTGPGAPITPEEAAFFQSAPTGVVGVRTEEGETISFAQAAAQVHGLSPEDAAELERMVAQRHQQAGQPAAPIAPTMGPASPLLNQPIAIEDAREEIMAVLQACEDPRIVNELFLGLLDAIDPADSDLHLALFQRLQASGRVHKMGTLDQPLAGYIYFYQEPKGTTKEGYTPGATQGGRMVDNAKAKIAESGVQGPVKRGMCSKCMKLVREEADGSIVTELDAEVLCGTSGGHVLA